MKRLATLAMALSIASPVFAQEGASGGASPDLVAVSPALAGYAESAVFSDLWQRPELSPRDRSLVTVAALIAGNQTAELAFHVGLALDNGVKPSEISGTLTHLAFYAGWGNAVAAAPIIKSVFVARNVPPDQIPAAKVELLPLDEKTEAARARVVEESVGPVSPALAHFTTNPLFRDLWLRPDLAPRDRSLVTVTSLIARGQSAQVTFHLNKAMDNGLTATEAGELVAHLAFYAGWPNAFSAAPVVRQVVEGRPS